MLTKTSIEWCHGNGQSLVWNFVTGCDKVSAGCAKCYAEAHAKRFWGERKFTDVQIHSDKINAPLRITKPANVFVNSMSDLFHEAVTDNVIQDALYVMEATPHVHYIVLTKRAGRMRDFFNAYAKLSCKSNFRTAPLANLTLGVSVESNQVIDRISYLQETPAAQRIISFEPLLEEVNAMSAIRSIAAPIHHAIIGGESGAGARPCHLDWISSLVYQCDMLNIGVFVKQLGARAMARMPGHSGEVRRYFTKSRKGNDPKEWPPTLQRRDLILPARPATEARNFQHLQ